MRGRNIQRLRAIFFKAADYLKGVDRVIDMLMEACLAVLVSAVSKHLDFLHAAVLTTDLALVMLLFLHLL